MLSASSDRFQCRANRRPRCGGRYDRGFGTAGSYSVQAIFFFLATFWSLKFRTKQRLSAGIARRTDGGESFGQSVIEGWKFSSRNHEVRTGLLVVTFASLLLIPFSTLLPVFARDILAVGAKGQGLLLTSMAWVHCSAPCSSPRWPIGCREALL
jgi:hypothetical protein